MSCACPSTLIISIVYCVRRPQAHRRRRSVIGLSTQCSLVRGYAGTGLLSEFPTNAMMPTQSSHLIILALTYAYWFQQLSRPQWSKLSGAYCLHAKRSLRTSSGKELFKVRPIHKSNQHHLLTSARYSLPFLSKQNGSLHCDRNFLPRGQDHQLGRISSSGYHVAGGQELSFRSVIRTLTRQDMQYNSPRYMVGRYHKP